MTDFGQQLEFLALTDTSLRLDEALTSIKSKPRKKFVLMKREKNEAIEWYAMPRIDVLKRLQKIRRGKGKRVQLSHVLDDVLGEEQQARLVSTDSAATGETGTGEKLSASAAEAGGPVIEMKGDNPVRVYPSIKVLMAMQPTGLLSTQYVRDALLAVGSPSGSAPEAPAAAAPGAPAPDAASSGTGGEPPPPGDPAIRAEPGKGPPRKPPADVKAYPQIEPKPQHVVQGRPFDVEVSLQAVPPDETVGEVRVPGGGPYTLDVHLLLGDQSEWQTLVYSHKKGTTKKAEFHWKAPVIPVRPDGTRPDRLIRTLVANFYLGSRWCGEGRRSFEVLLHDQLPPSAAIPKPTQPRWREVLHLTPGAQPPDLLVRIQQGSTEEDFEFVMLSPHFEPGSTGLNTHMILRNGPQRFVRDQFDQIAGAKLTDQEIIRIKGRCRDIYRSTPPAFQHMYWKLYHEAQQSAAQTGAGGGKPVKLETIQFVSDEPFIPWELMLVSDPLSGQEGSEEILAVRHSVGRWVASASCVLRPAISVRRFAVFASDYKQVPGVKPKLPWAAVERTTLHDHFGADPKELKYRTVLDFFASGKAQAVHFSCHGEMDVERPEESRIRLEDFDRFTTAFLESDTIRNGEGKQHPLIFLSACQTGAVGAQLGLVTGWPYTFLSIGASACVAPLWSVVDEKASEVSGEFYRLVFEEGVAMGEALRRIRAEWETKKSLTHLGYVLYGDPATRVERLV